MIICLHLYKIILCKFTLEHMEKKNLWMLKFADTVSPLGTKGVCVSNSALESGMYL